MQGGDKLEKLSGIVERITFNNEENGFCVIKIKSRGFAELITLVGNMAAVRVGSVISVTGRWKHDAKYGKQLVVENYTEAVPATIAGLEKYLGSGLIKGVGPVNAKRIVKVFKEKTLEIIEKAPDKLVEVEGIGPKRVEMIKKAWQEQKEIKNVMLFLQSQGVSTAFGVKIYKTYGDNSIEVVRDNPYRLADDIWGIGFKTADRIARQMGYDPTSFARCRAGVAYMLNELSGDGHCYAAREELVTESMSMLEVERSHLEAVIDGMIAEKSLILAEDDGLYLPPLYYSELGAARKIKEIAKQPSRFAGKDITAIVSQVEQENKVSYDQVQLEAVQWAVESKFMVLTGGPGTGKTTTTLAIIKVFEKLGAKVLLAAPTGRAAKRMAEATGREAKTVHRLLEYKPPEGFQKNEENLLKCDVLILDETSMVDIVLMYNLLKAVPKEAVVVLVGDVDQLPSVGPGNVLRDIIASGIVKVVQLTRIFRQAQGSLIVTNAHRINRGEFPFLLGGRGSDFFFIAEDDPEKMAEQIVTLCTRRLPAYYRIDPIDDIQVICPMNRGVVGAYNLNQILQQALNQASLQVQNGGTKYKLGDKVMQIRNNYDKYIFNGDLGRIKKIDLEDKRIIVSFDGRPVEYDVTELDELVLAYATTVHKSQGSEYKVVVAPIATQHFVMLQRNLLYTCVTRAKKVLVLIGSKRALAMAVGNNKINLRNTMLAKRLQE
jgi:exodeoxyribonuclease V alpha subunit